MVGRGPEVLVPLMLFLLLLLLRSILTEWWQAGVERGTQHAGKGRKGLQDGMYIRAAIGERWDGVYVRQEKDGLVCKFLLSRGAQPFVYGDPFFFILYSMTTNFSTFRLWREPIF